MQQSIVKRLPPLLSLFLAAISVLSAIAYGATWAQTNLWHRTGYPYDATITTTDRNNVDFLCFVDRFHFLHQAQFFGIFPSLPFNYPPPVAIAYRAFYRLGAHPEIWFFWTMISCLLVAAVLFTRALMQRGLKPVSAVVFTVISVGLSYPFAFAFYLANMELLVWAILALGIYLFVRGYGWQAAVLFGIAGSMKYFPIIFLALPLGQKRYRDAALVLLTCAVSVIVSTWWLGPNTRAVIHGIHFQTKLFEQFYINHFHDFESSIDHSLFGLFKWILFQKSDLLWVPRIAPLYLASVAVAGLALWFLRIRKLPLINQVMALSISSVLLPPVSHDYTLLHLYAPWAMLVLLALSVRRKGMLLAFVCFALLFTPQSYLIYDSIRFSGQFKAVVLVVLFVTSLLYPFDAASVEPPFSSVPVDREPATL